MIQKRRAFGQVGGINSPPLLPLLMPAHPFEQWQQQFTLLLCNINTRKAFLMWDLKHLLESTPTTRPFMVTIPFMGCAKNRPTQGTTNQSPNQPSTMSSHARHGSVEAVYRNINQMNAVETRQSTLPTWCQRCW